MVFLVISVTTFFGYTDKESKSIKRPQPKVAFWIFKAQRFKMRILLVAIFIWSVNCTDYVVALNRFLT